MVFLQTTSKSLTAHRLVQRAAKPPGTLLGSPVTFDAWREAQTTWAQLAAKRPQVGEHVAVSPAARPHRLNQRTRVFLQAMLRQALAKGPALEPVGADGLLSVFTKVWLADRTGVGLPDRFGCRCWAFAISQAGLFSQNRRGQQYRTHYFRHKSR
jgi:hypothetical protein